MKRLSFFGNLLNEKTHFWPRAGIGMGVHREGQGGWDTCPSPGFVNS